MDDVSFPRTLFLNGWRIAGWGSLLALLLIPALATQTTSEFKWTAIDFFFAALLLSFIGTTIELAVRFARPGAPRIGYILSGFTAFLTLWSNAAIGIIGDDDFVNLFFFLMVLVAILAGIVARFRPSVMRWITAVLGVGQYVVGIAAISLMPGHTVEWGFLSFFALFWFTAAWCFHRATSTSTTQMTC